MELSYETQGTNTYLVYAVPPEVALDMLSMGMLSNNRIPGLAQTIFTQMDSTQYIKYNISARVPSSQLFVGPITRRRFLGVLNGIVHAMLSAEEYMLEPNTILLDLNYMYSDIKTGDTVLVCVPVEGMEEQPFELKDFVKKIMYDTSFDQSENCDYITKIINYVNSSPTLVLTDFQEFLRSLELETAQNTPPRVPAQPAASSKPKRHVVERPAQPSQFPQVPQMPPMAQQVAQSIPATPPTPGPVAFPAVAEPPVSRGGAEDKPISLMYLLRHYSKENVVAYKAQQGKGKETDKKKSGGKKAKKGGQAPVNVGFMIPSTGGSSEVPLPPPASPAPAAPISTIAGRPAPESFTPLSACTPPIPQPGYTGGSFGETDFYPDGEERDETMVLGTGQGPVQALIPYLVRRKNNERIPVDKAIFRLGRDVDFNDYAILDNRYVGHSHCHLLQQDGEYFIQDDNSKNHTRVNGTIIPPGQLVKIAHGFIISVADEEFEFKLF